MNTPHYTARKVGDQYVTVRTDTPMGCEQPSWLYAGGAMLAYGLLRRGPLGLLLAGAGVGLIYRGVTGKNPMELLGFLASNRFDSAPTFQHDHTLAGQSVEQRPDDEIDEASMESFPASDPPARMTPAAT